MSHSPCSCIRVRPSCSGAIVPSTVWILPMRSWRVIAVRATIAAIEGEIKVTAPLIGYADRVSVRAGEKIAFKVSSVGPTPYNAMLVRIIRGDPNPDGLPAKLEDHSELFESRFASRQQHAWPGSYALIEA